MEIVAAISGSVVGKFADYFFYVPGRQLGYLVHYNDNIQSLKKQAHDLTNMQKRVQGKIDAATDNNEQIEGDVEEWVEKVKKIVEDANKFLEDEANADKRCLNGWCIDLSSRYWLSKEAQQKTSAISQLQLEGRFESVSRPAPPPGIISASTAISGALLSRQLLESEVMEALNDDNVSMIGICGMGGVGKTTLVKKIGKQAEEYKLFDKVVMAVVSLQNPNLIKVQGEIANMLGLTLDSDDESARARSLWVRIKKEKRILVILDDVWGRLELDRVGIPWGNDHKGCKIVLTSRSKDVCGDMNAKRIFTVEELLEKESWDLFRHAAGEVVDSSDIYPIARKVASKCGGLPLAILIVGKALKNKSNKYEWNDAANQLKKSVPTNIRGVEKEVILPLKLSYDYLESEEAKSCFLLCCLFPEDFDILVEALVSYGWGLSLFQAVDTVEEARDRAHTLVSTLIASHLLLERDGCVRMHDVVREVAIRIASKDKINFMVKASIQLKDWPNDENFENLTGISLMSNDIHELPEGHECPKLQTLLLQRNSPLKIHDMFFQGMRELRVLDMSGIRPLSLPPSLSVLANLLTLHLDDCKLGDISVIGKLSNLEILSFSRSDIKEISIYFGQLSRLRLFDLTDCEELALISPGVISSLRRLEELYMQNSFLDGDVDGGDSRSNATLFELQALPRLTSLHIRIPNASSLPTDMPFQDLTTFTISIGTTKKFFYVEDTYSRALSLTHDMKIPLLGWVRNLMKRTEHLDLTRFIGLRNIIPNLDNNGFNELKSLSIDDCEEMNYLLNTLEWQSQKAFHSLERLFIEENLNFTEICHGQLPAESLSKVKELKVRGCPKMLTIVPSHLLQILQNLESLDVRHCDSLVNAFEFEGLVHEKEEAKLLSKLRQLDLRELPQLVEIWKGQTELIDLYNLEFVELRECWNLKTVFPPSLLQSLNNLKSLTIWDCSKLEEIFGKQEKEEEGKEIVVWKKDPTSVSPTFPNLTRVYIWNCNELKTVFPPSLLQSLINLNDITIEYCYNLEEIFGKREKEEEGKEIVVRKKDPTSVSLTLANLTRVQVNNCKKLKTVFPPSLLQSLINLEDIKIAYCYNLEEIFGKQEKEEEGKEIVLWKKDPSFVSSALANLTRVSLWDCKKMRNLFSPSIVRGLAQLQELRVRDCRIMQEIVTDEETEEGASMERIVFPHLKQIKLSYLDSLTSFCSGRRYKLEWPTLEYLCIEGCPKMETFGYGDQVTPKLEKVILVSYRDDKWLWMGDLNATVQHLFKKRVMIEEEGSWKEGSSSPDGEAMLDADET